jgi:hypothetical protein
MFVKNEDLTPMFFSLAGRPVTRHLPAFLRQVNLRRGLLTHQQANKESILSGI